MPETQTADWATSIEHHRAAALSVAATARSVQAGRWNVPRGEGKWSPAEVVEHLRLTYATLRRELATGEGMRVRTPWLRRLVIRALFLRGILRTGQFPAGARAVREIRPAGGPFDQEATVRLLEEEALAFERELTARRGATLTHPIFGAADSATGLRFCTVHLLHHEQQLH